MTERSLSFESFKKGLSTEEIVLADSFSLASICWEERGSGEEVSFLLSKVKAIFPLEEFSTENCLFEFDRVVILLANLEADGRSLDKAIEQLSSLKNLRIYSAFSYKQVLSRSKLLDKKMSELSQNGDFLQAPFLLSQNICKEFSLLAPSFDPLSSLSEHIVHGGFNVGEILCVGSSETISKTKLLASLLSSDEKHSQNTERINLIILDRNFDLPAVLMHRDCPIQRMVDFDCEKGGNNLDFLVPSNQQAESVFGECMAALTSQKLTNFFNEQLEKLIPSEKEANKRSRPSIKRLATMMSKLDTRTVREQEDGFFKYLRSFLFSHSESTWEEMMSVEKVAIVTNKKETPPQEITQQICDQIFRFSPMQVLLLSATLSSLFPQNLDGGKIISEVEKVEREKDEKSFSGAKHEHFSQQMSSMLKKVADAKEDEDFQSLLTSKNTYLSLLERVLSELSSKKDVEFARRISLKKSNSLTQMFFSFTSKQEEASRFMIYFDGGVSLSEVQSLRNMPSLPIRVSLLSHSIATKKKILSQF